MNLKIRNGILMVIVFLECLYFIPSFAIDKPYLKSIYLSDGENINFSKDKYSYVVDVDSKIDQILIKAKPYDLQDEVRINGEIASRDDNYKKTVSLVKGKNKIEIEIKDNMYDDNISIYDIYVYRGGKDAVYLKDFSINSANIGFNKETKLYNIELDNNEDTTEIEATPEEGDYTITANGTKLNRNNSIKVKFNGIGKYTINMEVKDNDTQRVGMYTFNIYLGIPVTPNVEDAVNSKLKPNQWVIVNGRWRYNDSFGEPLKSTWYYDSHYGGYFHFNSRGNMETGWIEDNGTWYYLNENGIMKTDWLEYKNQWYYLDSNGAMKIGWLYNDNKWYYLKSDGVMATGWNLVNGNWYYLDRNGAMKTDWIYYSKQWYYLDDNGAMKIGWFYQNDNWYYLNFDGSMKSGEWIYYKDNWYYLNYAGNMRTGWLYKNDKYYYFNEDGSMRTYPITIDGYSYEFNNDGSVNFNN